MIVFLEFIAKFACSFLEKDCKTGDGDAEETSAVEEEDEELPLFLYRVFAWLLDHHEVEGADARLRVCQLLNKLLKYMGEEACIDDDLYNKIYDGMLERLKDKVAEIRAQAVTALQRLQDPKDEECPIIRAYLFHLAHDPNNIVRRTIVRCIGATRLTLPHILERTRDIDEHVRRAAYKFLAEKVHIKSLTINQREGVLKRGLGDRNENVKKVVEKEMIPAWLRLSNNNIVQLLHHLDVGNSDQDTKPGAGSKSAQAGALYVLFQDTPFKELVNSFQYLDNDKLIPFDKLTAETAMYWRVLAEYLAEQTSAPGAEEYLEMILPELSPFCQYVRKYILDLEKDDEDGNWEFVAKELIRMTLIYDLGDEVGRQNLSKLIKDLLTSSKTPVTFVSSLVEVFNKVEKNPQSRVDQVAEIISDLKDPLDADDNTGGSPDVFHSAPDTPVVTTADTRDNDDLVRSKQLQIAKLRVNMNMLKDQLDEAVNNQNFLSAQEIKSKMDQLEEEQIVLENQLAAAKAAGMAPTAKTVSPANNPAAGQLDPSDNVPDVDNPAVTLKCLRLLVATLQDPSITKLNSTLLTLLEEFVTISVQSEIAAIRKEAILALSCCCLRSIESARQHMLLLLQAAHIDVHEVRIAAITTVVDLLMKHGLASFITAEESDRNLDMSGGDSSSVSPSKCGDGSIDNAMESDLATRGATLTQNELNAQGGNSVVAILTKILDEPDMELRTEVAEGLCKLLMIGAISSPKLLSRLLLIWYNPMTESDSKLRHILGTFFPLYCSMTKFHQRSMEDAFVPTMKILFDAPVTSPLAEIDIEDVGMFFVHLTREDMLQSYNKDKVTTNIIESTTTSIHDSLAVSVCNQILSAPDGYQTKVLVKILTNLVLTHNNFVHLRELKVLSESLLRSIKEKSVIRSVEKFDKQLKDWLAKSPSIVNDDPDPDATKKTSATDSGDEGNTDGSMTPTRSRKRILFSQTLSNTLLDPEIPLKVSRTSSSSVYRSPTNKGYPSTDDEAFEDAEETTLVQDKDDDIKTVPESASEEEADSEPVKKSPAKKSKGKLFKDVEKSKAASAAPTESDSSQAASIEIMSVTEEENDDDIFSDASINSVNVSKLPKGSVLDNSTDSEPNDHDDTIVKKSPAKSKRGRTKKGEDASTDEAESTETETEESTKDKKSSPKKKGKSKIPSLLVNNKVASSPPSTPVRAASSRSSRSSATTSSTRSSRSSKIPTPVSTPTTTRKNTKTGQVSKDDAKSVSSPKTVKNVVDVSSPRTMSRAGRNNSPRIDYKTGKKIEESTDSSQASSKDSVKGATPKPKATPKTKDKTDVQSKTTKSGKNTPKATATSSSRTSTRKRAKESTPESARSSTTRSPRKKDAKRNLNDSNDSSDDFVESTPPATATRTRR